MKELDVRRELTCFGRGRMKRVNRVVKEIVNEENRVTKLEKRISGRRGATFSFFPF